MVEVATRGSLPPSDHVPRPDALHEARQVEHEGDIGIQRAALHLVPDPHVRLMAPAGLGALHVAAGHLVLQPRPQGARHAVTGRLVAPRHVVALHEAAAALLALACAYELHGDAVSPFLQRPEPASVISDAGKVDRLVDRLRRDHLGRHQMAANVLIGRAPPPRRNPLGDGIVQVRLFVAFHLYDNGFRFPHAPSPYPNTRNRNAAAATGGATKHSAAGTAYRLYFVRRRTAHVSTPRKNRNQNAVVISLSPSQ